VILEAKKSSEIGPNAINDLYVPSSNGQQVPLRSIVSIQERYGNLTINHQGQFPSTTISFNVSKGYALGDAVKAIQQMKDELNLPASLVTRFQGAALAFSASLNNTIFLIIAAIVTMYIVLGILY
jgi:multidrug efflux pump